MALLPIYDQVCVLLETPFSRWSEKDRKDFLNSEKPTPHLDVVREAKWKDKTFVRKFKSLWYSQFDWLCGSYYLKKLFCLPCLIICTKFGVWNTSGFGDFSNVSRSLHKHETSGEHLRCVLTFKQVKRSLSTVQGALMENSRLYIQKFNENVMLNRRLMELPIRATIFLAKQKLAFESDSDADKRGNFKKLLETFVDLSPTDIKEQYKKNSSVLFSGSSLKTVQNELINCIAAYIDKHEAKEIKECNFLSIQVADTTDLYQKPQCSVIFRYVVSGGLVKERFIGFYDVGSNRTANCLFHDVILNCLEKYSKYNSKSKLVSQCYDGAVVMSGQLHDLRTTVKEIAPRAVFVHSLAYHLNLVLEQSCYSISKCRIFFAIINGLSSFFHDSAKRTQVVETVIRKRIMVTRWTSNSKIINIVNDEWESLKQVFIQIIDDESFDQTSVRLSRDYLKEFDDFEFALLVIIFSDIFPLTDELSDILQKNSFDIDYCISQITSRQELIEQKKNLKDFRKIFNLAKSRTVVHCGGTDRVPLTEKQVFENYKLLFYEILDIISEQITSRFADISKIKFVALMDTSKFIFFSRNFPTYALDNLKEYCYPDLFNDLQLQRLKNELQIVYKQYQESELSDLMERLNADSDVFKETYKLFSIILTIPSISVSTERSFFCLKRIKTYLRNTMTGERLPDLAKISIEQDLLDELIATQPFYDDIINSFANLKDQKIDLILKK